MSAEPAVEAKEWQKGIPLEALKAVTAVISEWDRGLILGAFTKISERTVADWLSSGELRVATDPPMTTNAPVVAIAVVERAKTTRSVKDFSGFERYRLEPGTVIIKKIAARERHFARLERLLGDLPATAWFEGWMEHSLDRAFAASRGLQPVAVKVRASSELVGVFGPYPEGSPICAPADWPTLRAIGSLPMDLVHRAAQAIAERPPQLADHYSSYNLRHAWSAASLRGYAPEGEEAHPGFIIKPSEMAKAWKEENADQLKWVLRNSPLRAAYPELEPLIRALPADTHRIRLMNLAPGGGELQRHADITDPDAGTQDGQLLRIHIPLHTNPRVVFTGWNLKGEQLTANMVAGSVWYLDTRKPHRAVNRGPEHRLHLVMDVVANRDMRALLERGLEASAR